MTAPPTDPLERLLARRAARAGATPVAPDPAVAPQEAAAPADTTEGQDAPADPLERLLARRTARAEIRARPTPAAELARTVEAGRPNRLPAGLDPTIAEWENPTPTPRAPLPVQAPRARADVTAAPGAPAARPAIDAPVDVLKSASGPMPQPTTRLNTNLPMARRTPLRAVGDAALSLIEGTHQLPGMVAGAADLVLGGAAGDLLDATGFDPERTRAAAEALKSPQQRLAEQNVAEAQGFGGKIQAALENPTAPIAAAIQSVPGMLAGGALSRALPAAMSLPLRAGIGEGMVSAASQLDQTRRQSADGRLTAGQRALAVGTGVTTAAIGRLSAGLSQRYGFADPDALIAGAARDPLLRKSVARSIAEGAIAEGLEEGFQSTFEQWSANLANGRPIDEGVADNVVLGAFAGVLLGGLANVRRPQPAPAPLPPNVTATARIAPEVDPSRLLTGTAPDAAQGIEVPFTRPPAPWDAPVEDAQDVVIEPARPATPDAGLLDGLRARKAARDAAGAQPPVQPNPIFQAPEAAAAPTPAPAAPAAEAPAPNAPAKPAPNSAPASILASLRRRMAAVVDPTLVEERDTARRQADTDELTGLANQGAYRRALPAAEADPNIAIIRFDANGFKRVNDELGHPAGDQVLRDIAAAAQAAAGPGTRVFRNGGDEFTILAPTERAEAIRDAVEAAYGSLEVAPGVRTSISGGIGQTDQEADAAAIVRKAEQKKAQGIPARGEAPAPAPAAPAAPVKPPVEPPVAAKPRSLSSLKVERLNLRHILTIHANAVKMGGKPDGAVIYMKQFKDEASHERAKQRLKDLEKEIRARAGEQSSARDDDEEGDDEEASAPAPAPAKSAKLAPVRRKMPSKAPAKAPAAPAPSEAALAAIDPWTESIEKLKSLVPRAVPHGFGKMSDATLRLLTGYRQRVVHQDFEDASRLDEVESLLESRSGGRKMGYPRALALFGTPEDARRWQNVSEEAVDALAEIDLTPQDVTAMRKAADRAIAGQAALDRLYAEAERRGLDVYGDKGNGGVRERARKFGGKEQIIGVALRHRDTGKVTSREGFDGGHYGLAIDMVGDAHGDEEMELDVEGIEYMLDTQYERGFLTNKQEFVDRQEGLDIARAARQVRPVGPENELTSETLQDDDDERGLRRNMLRESAPAFGSRLPASVTINGTQRPTTNSLGQPIAKDLAGVRNFWKWFGDSKVVDAAGRPLVVYHGAGRHVAPDDAQFTEFRRGEMDAGFGWFSENEDHAGDYANDRIVSAYLRFRKPVALPNSYGRTVGGWLAAMRKSGVDTSAMRVKPWDGFEYDGKFQFWEFLENNYGTNNIVEELQRQGFDGIVAPEERDYQGRNYVLLDPAGVKDIDNDGTFGPTANIMRERTPAFGAPRPPAPMWYSALERAIQRMKMPAMPAADWWAWLTGSTRKTGIKRVELDAVGVEEWLKLKRDPRPGMPGARVTKEELLAFVRANGVQVDEVMLGAPDARAEGVGYTILDNEDNGVGAGAFPTRAAAEDWLRAATGGEPEGWHVAPANYEATRAMLEEEFARWLTDHQIAPMSADELLAEQAVNPELSEEQEAYVRTFVDRWETMERGNLTIGWRSAPGNTETRFGMYQEPGGTDYRELALTLPKFSPHWQTPQGHSFGSPAADVNRLGWARFNTRVGPNGERVLNLEELQSDQAQKGVKQGFKQPRTKEQQAELERLNVSRLDLTQTLGTAQLALTNALMRWTAAANAALPDNATASNLRSDAYDALDRNDQLGFDTVRDAMQAIRQSPDWRQRWDVPAEDGEIIDRYATFLDDFGAARGAEEERTTEVYAAVSDAIDAGTTVTQIAGYPEAPAEVIDAAETYRAAKGPANEANSAYTELWETLHNSGVDPAPYITDTRAWTALVMKRMIRYAAEHGFDAISWTPGVLQTKRYEKALRAKVDRIEWTKTQVKDGAGMKPGVQLVGMKHGQVQVDTTEKETALSDAIGKAMAERIRKDPAQSGVIEGKNITIDKTGMAAYYDGIVPSVTKEIVAPLGATVTRVVLPKTEREPLALSSNDLADLAVRYMRGDLSERELRDEAGVELSEGDVSYLEDNETRDPNDRARRRMVAESWARMIRTQYGAGKATPAHWFLIPEALKRVALEQGFSIMERPKKFGAKADELSLFTDNTQVDAFGRAPSVADSEVGKRGPAAPKVTGSAPALPGAIDAEEMTARRDELGFEPRALPGMDDERQDDLFGGVRETAYHGSPYAFDRFTTEKMGTGEGAQAFGWGLYFAENEGIARGYHKRLAKTSRRHNTFDGKRITAGDIKKYRESADPDVRSVFGNLFSFKADGPADLPAFLKSVADHHRTQEAWHRKRAAESRNPNIVAQTYGPEHHEQRAAYSAQSAAPYERVLARVANVEEKKSGAVYRVDIRDEAVATFLDWDKPLSEQPAAVQRAFKAAFASAPFDINAMTREQLIGALQYNDPNGSWSDENARAEGLEPLTLEEARAAVLEDHGDGSLLDYLKGGVSLTQSGQSAYKQLVGRMGGGKQAWTANGQELASKALLAAGVRGIRFLDGSSRRQGDGTRNLVVFDEHDVTITHRNGELVTKAEREQALDDANPGRVMERAYHGTPHTFAPEPGHPAGRFRADKIGSGEGAAAYGWGVAYLAQNPKVGEEYQRNLTARARANAPIDASVLPDLTSGEWAELLALKQQIHQNVTSGRPFNATESARYRELADKERAYYDAIEQQRGGITGNLYTVEVPDEAVATFLDFDKSLAEQAPAVRRALATLGFTVDPTLETRMAELQALNAARAKDRLPDNRMREELAWHQTANEIDALRKQKEAAARGSVLYRSLSLQLGRDRSFGSGNTRWVARAMDDEAASKALLAAGVRGIKFLDGNSRATGNGTYNLVVFSEDDLTITHRNGEPVTRAEKDEYLDEQQSGRVSETAYHGTPHIWAPEPGHPFGRVRGDKVGTGEGAQAFGWGVLYAAQNEATGEGYRRSLARRTWRYDGEDVRESYRLRTALEDVDPAKHGGSIAKAIAAEIAGKRSHAAFAREAYGSDTAEMYLRQAETLESLDQSKLKMTQGALYRLEIRDEAVKTYLDWDKPLSEQAPAVLRALRSASKKGEQLRKAEDTPGWDALAAGFTDTDELIDFAFSGAETGEDFYRRAVEWIGNQESASKALLSAGIRGIKFLDGGSRGPMQWIVTFADGTSERYDSEKIANKAADVAEQNGNPRPTVSEGTRNLVVFDENDVTVTHRNGTPVPEAEREQFLDNANPGRVADRSRRPDPQQLGLQLAPGMVDPQSAVVTHGSLAKRQQAIDLAVLLAGGQATVVPPAPPPTVAQRKKAIAAHQADLAARVVAQGSAYVEIKGQSIGDTKGRLILPKLHRLLLPFRSPLMEMLGLAFLDDKGNVLGSTLETSGVLSAVSLGDMNAYVARLVERAQQLGATRIIQWHNHPSGDPTPSDDDRGVSHYMRKRIALEVRRLQALGQWTGGTLEYEGHYVINHERGTFMGLSGYGIDEVRVEVTRAPGAVDWTDALGTFQVNSPDALHHLIRTSDPLTSVTVGYFTSQRRILALEYVDPSQLDTIAQWLPKRVEALGARGAMIVVPSQGAQADRALTRKLDASKLPEYLEEVGFVSHDANGRPSIESATSAGHYRGRVDVRIERVLDAQGSRPAQRLFESAPDFAGNADDQQPGAAGLRDVPAGDAAPAGGESVPAGRERRVRRAPAVRQAAGLADAEARLAVLHNLSADNLAFADKLGGLSVPSLGILPAGEMFEGMGEITLLGKPHLGDPTAAPIHDADAYSPTFPRAEYKAPKSKDVDRLVALLTPAAKTFDETNIIAQIDGQVLQRPDPEDVVSQILRSNAGAATFLASQGVTVKPVVRPALVEVPWVQTKAWKDYRAAGGALMPQYDDTEARSRLAQVGHAAIDEYFAAHPDEAIVMDSYVRAWTTDDGLAPFNAGMRLERAEKAVGRQDVDFLKTRDRIARALKGKELAFKAWVEQQVLPMFGEPYLTIGRKKAPFTLDNIVTVMSGPVLGQEKTMTYGAGKARAAASVRFTDLQWMRNASSQIKTGAALEEARKAAKALISEYQNAVLPYYRYQDTWSAMDGAMRAFARVKRSGLAQALRMEDFRGVPDEVIALGKRAYSAFINAPVPYFEAKPQRAVTLDEFAGAVIPRASSAATKAILAKHGIDFRTYNPNKSEGPASRAAAIAKLQAELGKAGRGVVFEDAPKFGARAGVEQVPVAQVRQYREFQRTPSKALLEDIRQNGIREPLLLEYSVADHALRLTEGNTRLAAAEALGMTEVPVSVVRREGSFPRRSGANAPVPLSGPRPTQRLPEQFAPSTVLPARATIEVDGVQRPTENSRGKPIHPTEGGIRNFWRWFGDSVAVDAQGRPLVMYHGTGRQEGDGGPPRARATGRPFDVFEDRDGPIWLTIDDDHARQYAEARGDDPFVFALYLRTLKPLDMDALMPDEDDMSVVTVAQFEEATGLTLPYLPDKARKVVRFDFTNDDRFVSVARAAGYDSVKQTEISGTSQTYGALNANQVKSATDNSGKFSRRAKSVVREAPPAFGAGNGGKGPPPPPKTATGTSPSGKPLPDDLDLAASDIDYSGKAKRASKRMRPTPLSTVPQQVADRMANDLGPLERLGQRADTRPFQNPDDLLALARASDETVHRAIHTKVIDPITRQDVGPSYHDIFAPLKGDAAKIKRALTYVYAKRIVHRGIGAVAGNSAKFERLRAAARIGDRDPELRAFADRWTAHVDAIGNYAVKSGLWTPELWKRIKASDIIYVRIKRILRALADQQESHETERAKEAFGGVAPKKTIEIKPGVDRFTGSDMVLENPAIALLEYDRQIIHRSDIYRVVAAVFDAVDKLGVKGADGIAQRVPLSPTAAKKAKGPGQFELEGLGEPEAAVADLFDPQVETRLGPELDPRARVIRRNGPRGPELLQIDDPTLWEALVRLTAPTPYETSLLLRSTLGSLRAIKRVFTATTTGLAPAFTFAVNPQRDVVTAQTQSQAGMTARDTGRGIQVAAKNLWANLFDMTLGQAGEAGARAAARIAPPSPKADEMSRHGVTGVAMVDQDSPAFNAATAAPTHGALKHLNILRRTLTAPLVALEHVGRASDLFNRAAEYEAALRKFQPKVQSGAWTAGEAKLRAARLARIVTQDFSTQPGDKLIRGAAKVTPFLAASLRGPVLKAQAATRNPKRFGAIYGAMALAAVAAWVLRHATLDDDDREEFNDRPATDRAAYAWIPVGRADNGQIIFAKVALGQEDGVLFAAITSSLDALYDNDPAAGANLVAALERAMPAGVNEIAHATVPLPGIQQLMENRANKRVYGGRSVEPRGMMDDAPKDKRFESTPATYDLVAAGMRAVGAENVSPLQVENVARGLLSKGTPFVTAATDPIAAALMGQARTPQIDRPLRQSPINPASALLAMDPPARTESEERFYDRLLAVRQLDDQYKKAIAARDLVTARSLATERKALVPAKFPDLLKNTEERLKASRAQADVVRERFAQGRLTEEEARTRLDEIRRDAQAMVRRAMQRLENP